MAIVPAILQPGIQLTTSAVAIYTVPPAGHAVIKRAVFTNVTASPVTITANRVPSAGSVLTANEIIPVISISANTVYIANELGNMVLNSGDAIYALASSATAINAFISGFTF